MPAASGACSANVGGAVRTGAPQSAQPSAARAASMSSMIFAASAFGSVLTVMTAPSVSAVSRLRKFSTLVDPCTGGSTQ